MKFIKKRRISGNQRHRQQQQKNALCGLPFDEREELAAKGESFGFSRFAFLCSCNCFPTNSSNWRPWHSQYKKSCRLDRFFLSCVSGSTQLWGNERRRCPMFLFQLNNRSTNGCGSERCLYQDEKRVVSVDNGGSSNTRPTNGYVILAACVDDSIEVNSAFKCSARSLNLLLRSSSFEYLNKFWSTKYFPVSSPQHEVCFFFE